MFGFSLEAIDGSGIAAKATMLNNGNNNLLTVFLPSLVFLISDSNQFPFRLYLSDGNNTNNGQDIRYTTGYAKRS